MPPRDIIELLTQYIMTELAPASAPGPDTPIIDLGIVDSLDLFKLIAFVEEEFKVTIPPEDILAENFATLNDIKRTIESRLP